MAALKAIAAKRRPTHPYFDPFDAVMALWGALDAEHAATKAGREFSRVPRPEREISEAEQAA